MNVVKIENDIENIKKYVESQTQGFSGLYNKCMKCNVYYITQHQCDADEYEDEYEDECDDEDENVDEYDDDDDEDENVDEDDYDY